MKYTATVTVRFPDFVSNAIIMAKQTKPTPKITYTGKPPEKSDRWHTTGTTGAEIVTTHENVRGAFEWVKWVVGGNGGTGTIHEGKRQLLYYDMHSTHWYGDMKATMGGEGEQ